MAATIETELEEVKGKWQQTQQELDKTKSELHDVREELERSQSQLDEVLGELEQTHFELYQLKEKGEQKQSESDGEVKQELEETKSKLQETEQLLEQSQSQLGETMGVLEEYQSQMEKTMGTLEESQEKLQQKQEELEEVKAELAQKQSGSESELHKELEETKSQLRESEQLLEQYQSQLEETMLVLEESQSQLSKLREKEQQQQSMPESEVHKELEETKAQLRETEQLLEEYQSQLSKTMEVLEQQLQQDQLREKQEQQHPGSDSELQKELEETKAQLRETEELLERSQSQLDETMDVLEEYKSKLEQRMEILETSQSQLQQKESGLEPEVEKTKQLSKQLDEENRLFKIQNAIVKPILIQGGKWVGGVVFPDEMPEIFRHRRSGNLDQQIVYMDQNVGSYNSGNRQIDNSNTYSGIYIYGGPFHPHFGHALTESIHRLWAFDISIHDGIVFAVSLRPKVNPINYTPPQWFIQALEILDIPLAKCIWVTNDCTFENLIIPEPGSELTLGPKKWYRSYLERLQDRICELTHHLRKDKPQKLFLGRNHLSFGGSLAGDKYLETLLVNEGYISLKPEDYDLLQQLAYIISAKKIIFSEGSAIYSIEFINYLEAEIACIPRKTSNQPFYPHLQNKCHNYIVAGSIDDILPLGDWERKGIKNIPISKNPDQIIESLRKHNFALLKDWDENKFLAEEKDDFMTYVDAVYLLPKQYPVHREAVVEKYLQIRGTIQDNSTAQVDENIPTRSRSDRLNKLASINQSSRYLEIGVSKGITFNAVNVTNKVAVDPQFRLNKNKYATEKVVFLEVSSDEFFRSYAEQFKPFDLIYLDGLHTFAQIFRDFCATLAYGHSKTIWLIDDTCPGSYAQAQVSLQCCRQIQKFSGEKDGSWMGDVFKIVAAIHDFFPQYSFATFPDHGQTVVWNHPRTDFEPKWNSLETISRLEYSDFIELQSTLFKRESYENIFARIRNDLGKF
ncbi:MAG: glycosyltransferase 61 family protein [Trichodesmium sp. MO_231.B1]|nr:glycosyltransferase 61 family protein [Trichodesmium sp. MO_231.B1]